MLLIPYMLHIPYMLNTHKLSCKGLEIHKVNVRCGINKVPYL